MSSGPKAYDIVDGMVDYVCPTSEWKHANTPKWLTLAQKREIFLIPKQL